MYPLRFFAVGCAVVTLGLITGCSADPPPAESPPGTTAPTTPAVPTTGPTTGPTTPGGPATGPTTPGGPTTPPDQARQRALPIYYVVDIPGGFLLYREFHQVRTADPASDAVREMLARDRGIDPDYRSAWPTGTKLHSPVKHAKGVITVDLTAQARDGLAGAELEAISLQQLVYTVGGALQSTDPVQILIEGKRVDDLWGHVSVRTPIQRANPYDVRPLVQINDPNDGAKVPRTFTVTGEAAAFEANVPWEVLRGDVVVLSGFTMTDEALRFSPFSFSLTLEPGEYVLRVMEADLGENKGRPAVADTRRILVQP